jgi:hypothetical protein
MNYAVEIGSCALIDILRFIKTGSDIQKLTGGIDGHTDSMVIS